LAGSLALFAVVSLAWGQDPARPATTGEAKAAKKAYDPSRRVPPYFGQVGLTPEQREKVYKVRAAYFERIAALKAQLERPAARCRTSARPS
jgi:hypothetical protein